MAHHRLTLTLTLVWLSLLNGCGNSNSLSQVKSSFLCPFSGVEMILEMKPNPTANSTTDELLANIQQVLQTRIASLNLSSTAVVNLNQEQILIQLTDVDNINQIQQLLGSTGLLDFRQQKQGTQEQLRGKMIEREQLYLQLNQLSVDNSSNFISAKESLQRLETEIAQMFTSIGLTGNNVIDANPHPLQINNRPLPTRNTQQDVWQVTIQFDLQGEQKFTELTKRLAGTGLSIGIFLDNQLLSSPSIGFEYAETGISGGRASISGNFNSETANDLAVKIRSGALPTPVQIISTQEVNNNRCE